MKKITRIIIVCLLLSSIYGRAALESRTYETIFNPSVLEFGDSVPNDSRILPRSATVTFDLNATPPSLTAVIHNAVLEGGSTFYSEPLGISEQPFELIVRSSSGTQLEDGSYSFTGDYMGDLASSRTQWGFEWQFSEIGNGIIRWDGGTGWGGGHIWAELISGIALQVHPYPYRAESIFIENASFENGLQGWDDGLYGEIRTYTTTPRFGFIDGTNVLRIAGHEFDTPYRSQTLEEVIRSNSVYVLEVAQDGSRTIIALQDGSNSMLAEAIGPYDPAEGVFSTYRLIYAVPQGHESIGKPLKIYLGHSSPRYSSVFDNIRLTRYFLSPRLTLKPTDGKISLSATNLISDVQYLISRTTSLTNSPASWTNVWTFDAPATSTNFMDLVPTNTSSPSCFYKLEWDE